MEESINILKREGILKENLAYYAEILHISYENALKEL